MSYTASTISIRANTNVPFKDYSDEIKAYIEENYVVTGMRISVEKIISEDATTRTYTTVWVDQAAHETFLNDPIMLNYITELEAYNTANDIFVYRA